MNLIDKNIGYLNFQIIILFIAICMSMQDSMN